MLEFCFSHSKAQSSRLNLYTSSDVHGDIVSEIDAVVKVVDSHLCGWVQFPAKAAVFFIEPITVLRVF